MERLLLWVLLSVHIVEVVQGEGVREAHENAQEVASCQGLRVCPVEVEDQGCWEVRQDLRGDFASLDFAALALTRVDFLAHRFEDLPHESEVVALLQSIEELSTVHNVHEVVEVVVLDYLSEAALTLDVDFEVEEAGLVNPALLPVALAVEKLFETLFAGICGEASVNQLEHDGKHLSRVTLDVQVEEALKVVHLEDLHAHLIEREDLVASRFACSLDQCLQESSFCKGYLELCD